MEEKANVILAYHESGTIADTVFKTETIVLEDMTAKVGWGVPYGSQQNLFTLYQTTEKCLNAAPAIHPNCIQVNSLSLSFRIVKQQLKKGLDMKLEFLKSGGAALGTDVKIYGSTFSTNLLDQKERTARCDISDTITCKNLKQLEREQENTLSFKMAIWPSATVRVAEVILTISFVDPAEPTQILAKLSHTMKTQTMLYDPMHVDQKEVWVESGNSLNAGVQAQADLASAGWTITKKYS